MNKKKNNNSPIKFRAPYKSGKYHIFPTPNILNIYNEESYESTVRYINSLDSIIKNKYKNVIISFVDCEYIKAAAMMILYAKIETILKKSDVNISIKTSLNNEINKFIKQVGKVLITDNPEVFEIRRNGEWYNNMNLAEFLGLCSMTTHSRIISRDMFQKRMENNEEIHMNEILYPILQGYDSKVLDSDLTIVGSDQLFNEMMGRFFQEKYNQEKQIIITTKITKGLWGEEKQSKSIGNYIALEDTSKDKFGKAMKLTDDRIIEWMKVYTDISLEEIEKIEESIKNNEINPRDIKLMLAYAITEKYHGKEVADKEKEDFLKTFSDKVFPEDAEIVTLSVDKINIIELLNICFKNTKSKGELKRLITQGGVMFNEKKIENISDEIVINSKNQLKVGKRNFFKVILENY